MTPTLAKAKASGKKAAAAAAAADKRYTALDELRAAPYIDPADHTIDVAIAQGDFAEWMDDAESEAGEACLAAADAHDDAANAYRAVVEACSDAAVSDVTHAAGYANAAFMASGNAEAYAKAAMAYIHAINSNLSDSTYHRAYRLAQEAATLAKVR